MVVYGRFNLRPVFVYSGRCSEICDVMLHHVLSFPSAFSRVQVLVWKEQESRFILVY